MTAITFVAWTLAVTGCGLAQAPDAGAVQLAPGRHEVRVVHEGRTRLAIVHVPPAAATGDRLPVVLAFHGGGGQAEGFRDYAGLDAVADREGFVVVYPYGSGVLPRWLLTWNAGAGCCGYALDRNIDDVGFAIALLDRLAALTRVDGRRVYATGHSNGAMMAYRLAAERPDRVAAIAPVGGAMDLDAFSPAMPVPVLHIHSVDDPRALYGALASDGIRARLAWTAGHRIAGRGDRTADHADRRGRGGVGVPATVLALSRLGERRGAQSSIMRRCPSGQVP